MRCCASREADAYGLEAAREAEEHVRGLAEGQGRGRHIQLRAELATAELAVAELRAQLGAQAVPVRSPPSHAFVRRGVLPPLLLLQARHLGFEAAHAAPTRVAVPAVPSHAPPAAGLGGAAAAARTPLCGASDAPADI